MKKTLALILAFMLVLVTLVSCGGEAETESQKESESESTTESSSETESSTESGESSSETESSETETSNKESYNVSTSFSDLDEHIKVISEALTVRSSKDSSDDKNVVAYVKKDVVLHRVAIDGDWSKIIYNDQEAYVFSKYVVLTKTADDNYATGTVTSDAVNVRSSANTESSDNIVGTLVKGNTVSVVSLIDGWARVYYTSTISGYEGEAWIKATYLKIENVSIDTENGETESETSESETESESTETETKPVSDIISALEMKFAAYDSITASDYTVYISQSMNGQTTDTVMRTVAKTNSTENDDVYMALYSGNETEEKTLIDEMFIIAGVCCDANGNEITEGALYDSYSDMLLQGYGANDYLKGFIVELEKSEVKLAQLTNGGNKFMFLLDVSEIVEMYQQVGLNVNAEDSYYKIECDFSGDAFVATLDMYIAVNGEEAQPITLSERIVLDGIDADVQFPDITAEN